MRKCIIVWGETQVGFDGARAFVPIQEYPLGLGDAADKAQLEKAKAECNQKPEPKPKSHFYFWEAGQVDHLTSPILKITEGYTNA
jgi:hypothetical protein